MTDPQSPPVGAAPGLPAPPVPPGYPAVAVPPAVAAPPAVWPPPEWPPLPPGYYYPLPQPGQPAYPYAYPYPQQPAVPPQQVAPVSALPGQVATVAAQPVAPPPGGTNVIQAAAVPPVAGLAPVQPMAVQAVVPVSQPGPAPTPVQTPVQQAVPQPVVPAPAPSATPQSAAPAAQITAPAPAAPAAPSATTGPAPSAAATSAPKTATTKPSVRPPTPAPAATPTIVPSSTQTVMTSAPKAGAKSTTASKSAASNPSHKPAPKNVAPSYRDRLQTITFKEWAHRRLREAPGYIVSVLLHIVVLSSLSLMVIPAKDREELFNTIMAETKEPVEVNDKLDDTQIVPEKLDHLEASASTMQVNSEIVTEKPSPVELDVSDAAPTIEAPDPTAGNGPNMPKGALAGRSQKGRSALLASQGGTAASEQAVNSGLKWLAKQQRPDGSWSFKHGPDDPGALDNPTGATGLALLAFLGGGHTHKSGDYQKQVAGGLAFLGSKMVVTGAGGDLRLQGDMYTQGICTIALCEAYALSKDKNLKQPTQLAINFIVNAQDAAGGGWRYQPGTKGDTSVVGWQVMALKSGKIANLQIPNKTIGKATFFLNNVQAENGAKYGYDTPGAGIGTTAVGLLCRMYLGWTPKNQGLVKGVEYLSATGPQPANIYFDYYATQVLHHWGGEPWTKWNNVMREYLVTTQEKSGAAAGSWAPTKSHDDVAGGRLYRTCMSVMTLEVYYRHLPLYQRETIKVDF